MFLQILLIAYSKVDFDSSNAIMKINAYAYLFVALEVIFTFAFIYFFIGMFYNCLNNKSISRKSREGWAWIFLIFVIFGAILYYVKLGRKQIKLKSIMNCEGSSSFSLQEDTEST